MSLRLARKGSTFTPGPVPSGGAAMLVKRYDPWRTSPAGRRALPADLDASEPPLRHSRIPIAIPHLFEPIPSFVTVPDPLTSAKLPSALFVSSLASGLGTGFKLILLTLIDLLILMSEKYV